MPCSEVQVEWLGFVNIPLLSFLAFTTMNALLVAAHLRSKPMSRKSKRNAPQPGTRPRRRPPPARGGDRAAAASSSPPWRPSCWRSSSAVLFYRSEKAQAAQRLAAKNTALLATRIRRSSARADAKVHIVEFLDPACETCAVFYPHVKKLMADNPGRIRLSIRHVPFHQGSEHVVRMLEAARGQDKYWEALEAVFASQDRWTVNHRVYPERRRGPPSRASGSTSSACAAR